MFRLNLIIILQVIVFSLKAQIIDDFSDGNFSDSPKWSGNQPDFIINSSKQLQLNSAQAGISYLSATHSLNDINNKEWRFWIKMTFSPSSNNYSRIYLTAVNSDLSIQPDGFYLQFGESGSTDAVRLMKQENGIINEVCAGIQGEIASSFAISVRVIRDDIGNWKLYIDPSGGENFTAYAIGNDSTPLVGSCFGVLAKYTISNATKFYFDNFYVGNEILDLSPPTMLHSTAIFSNQVDVLFDQPLEITSAQSISNFTIDPTIEIGAIVIDNLNSALVHIALNSSLQNGKTYKLTSKNIADNSGNISGNQTSEFTFMIAETPVVGDVILSEFMADPLPSNGLQEVEYVEIFNRSTKFFNLQGWKIGDNSGDGTLDQKWIRPGEYVVLCAVSSLSVYPESVGVTNFPSLNNAGDDIILKYSNGNVIDKIDYKDGWYSDIHKKEGGFSLERINQKLPCSNASNWKASNAVIGGTPGYINSVNDTLKDNLEPFIKNLLTPTPNQLEIYFSEGMDSSSLVKTSILISPDVTITNRKVASKYTDLMVVDFSENLVESKEYTITIGNVADCSMNSTNLTNVFARSETPSKGDIIINEILFDPITGGSDFIELYNKSSKWIDIKDFNLANYEKGGPANNSIILNHFQLKPGEYLVVTPDSLFQKQHFPFSVSGRFIQQTLPNYNVDSSTVFLLFQGQIMDQVSYDSDWHFQLLNETKGKSLERITSEGNSTDAKNWHTAAESVSFATPGRVNSQNYGIESEGIFEYSSKTISPDNDGFEDVLFINYQLQKPGMVGTFSIYDDQGRLVRTVVKNELLAKNGSFIWDGILDANLKAHIGSYIGLFEFYDIDDGTVFSIKKAIVVACKR